MEVLEGIASGMLANLAVELISSLKKKHHGIKEKKERLEELLVIIHSVIDAAKAHVISNKWLRKWLKNLKAAAEQGDHALVVVKRRIKEEKVKSETNKDGRHKPPESPLGIGWNRVLAPFSVAQTFAKKLFSHEDDATVILTAALRKVESACRNAKLFLRLLKLESKPNNHPGIVMNGSKVIRRHKLGSKKTHGPKAPGLENCVQLNNSSNSTTGTTPSCHTGRLMHTSTLRSITSDLGLQI